MACRALVWQARYNGSHFSAQFILYTLRITIYVCTSCNLAGQQVRVSLLLEVVSASLFAVMKPDMNAKYLKKCVQKIIAVHFVIYV